MDILSLTASTVNRPDPHSRPLPSPGAEASDKAPPGSGALSPTLQKEAARTGQKTPETVLDRLEANLGTDLGLSVDARKVLGQIELPPSVDDLLAIASALGAPVTHLPTAASDSVKPIAAAIEASNLPKPVKSALTDLIKTSSVQPLPAANLIDMGREMTPTPPTQAPVAFSQAAVTPVPAAPGFASDSVQDKASGQRFADGLAEELNIKLISSTVDPVASTDMPDPTSVRPIPANLKPKVAAPNVQVVPNPTSDPITLVTEVPNPTVTTVVPKPTNQTLLEKPAPNALGRPESNSGSVDPAGKPTVTIVPNPTANPQPTTVPNPTRGQQPLPVDQVPEASTVELQPASTATIKPSSQKPEPNSGSIDSIGSDKAPIASSIKIVASSDSNALDLFNDDDDDATPIAASSGKGSVDPKPVEIRPEPMSSPSIKPTSDPLPKPTSEKVVDQVSSRIETMANGKKPSQVTVHLEPRDLGSITLTVKALGQKVDASVQTSNDDVRASLIANRHMLVQNVEGRGLTLNSFDITQNPNGQGQQADQATHQEFVRGAQLRQAMAARTTVTAPSHTTRPKTSAMDYTV